MMDVSDGVLIDAARMARASGLALEIALDRLPLSEDVRVSVSDELAIRLAAATAGDDYQLLFAASPDVSLPVPAIDIGRFEARSAEHTSEIQSLMRISYAVFRLTKKRTRRTQE